MSGVSGTYGIITAVTTTPDAPTQHRRISRRAAAVAPSATLAVDAKAKALQAAGEHVIGFGAGEPDFPTPAHIVEAAVVACRDPANHRYTPTGGHPGPARGLAAKTLRDSALLGHPAAGAGDQRRQAGHRERLRRAVRPGRRNHRPRPLLDDLPRVDRAGGRRARHGGLRRAHAGSAPPSRTSRRRSRPRTKALLFVSPSNPTGAVYPRDEIEAIGRWAVERGLWVLTDEIYEHLVYGGAEHHSMPVLVPELADRCLVVNGVAKTYAMTGWRVGWLHRTSRCDHGRDQHPEPRDLQRLQRDPARGAGRRLGWAGGRGA